MLHLITINVFRYSLHTVSQGVFELRLIPQSCLCSSDSVPVTKGKATKQQAMKCPRNEVYLRRNGGDETAATKHPAPRRGALSQGNCMCFHGNLTGHAGPSVKLY